MPAQKQIFQRASLVTPIGGLWVVSDRQGHIRACDFHDYEARMLKLLGRHYPTGFELESEYADTSTKQLLRCFEAYFEGETRALAALPVATGGSEFQRDVWRGLREIPLGTTQTYGGLAERLGRPRAVRAVGLANGANPIAIVVPCHRVIGASGALTGYAGGLARKRWLLQHEGVSIDTPTRSGSLPFEGGRV
ncbi:MAG: hypothetical protein RL701_402 [Pseudomonadota bacterium]